jgi:ribonucleoside-diphosphate reductase alpha chain
MSRFAAPIAEQIWDMKYRLKSPEGKALDETVEDTWARIARALAAVEDTPSEWEPRFYAALEDFRYLPAGRIVAGAGTGRSVTLFNCFVMGTIPDSMAGIFEALKEAALTMQQGGGIGYDFSTIRPKGAPVSGVAADASGPLSFMDVWDAMCRTIMSAGSRRGAMMATMRCDHPDIEDFIAAKADPARLRMFNVSVLATDAFMEAVKADGPWELTFGGQVYKTLPARDLWNKMMRATYDYAEPGVIFIDRINAENNLQYAETIAATNPCGEQPLPPYGACLLGSINLARLVAEPFAEGADIDTNDLADLVATSIRMMDNVVDASRFPLEAQAQEAHAKRRIGLGVTGLADALAMTGLRYGSEEAAARTGHWMEVIANAAYRASALIAAEKGAFPLYDAAAYAKAPMIRRLDPEVQALIARHGLRNALLTSVAPTGTISLYAGNVSSGIEPVFAHAYTRKVLMPDGTRREEEVVDYAVQLWRDLNGDADLPAHFVTAQDLAPLEHVRMQAAAQPWVDSSISKTINVPADIGFETFKDVYLEAYETGCKGCTTYRPNDVTGSVLSVGEQAPAQEDMGSPTFIMSFAEAFQKRRSASGLTLTEIAERGGVSQDILKKLSTRNTSSTNVEDAMRIASVFGLSVEQFVSTDAPGGTAGQPPIAPRGRGFNSTRGRGLPTLPDAASRLKWAQEQAGFTTQQAAAEALGVQRSRYSHWVGGGTQSLSAEGAKIASKVFNVTPGWLLFGETPEPSDPALLLVQNTAGEAPQAPQAPGAEPPSTEKSSDIIYMSEPLDRPQSLEGHTYKLKWPDSDHALYITINDIILHGHRRPFEIFINSKNMEHYAWIVALTRMVSAVFRRGGDVSFVVEELKAVFDPRGGAWMGGKYVPSIIAAIGGVIERHLISIGFIDGEGMGLKTDPRAEVVNLGRPAGPACPACGQYEMRMLEGCLTCANCGHSKCG